MTATDGIREAARRLMIFDRAELEEAAKVADYGARKTFLSIFKGFVRNGEVERIEGGRFRYLGRNKTTSLRQRLWDVARRMVRFNLDDLERITGGNRASIQVFTTWMVKAGYAQRLRPGHFQIIGRLKPNVPGCGQTRKRGK